MTRFFLAALLVVSLVYNIHTHSERKKTNTELEVIKTAMNSCKTVNTDSFVGSPVNCTGKTTYIMELRTLPVKKSEIAGMAGKGA